MPTTTTTSSAGAASDGFFGRIAEGFATGLSDFTGNILPRFAEQQLLDQRGNQLERVTFQQPPQQSAPSGGLALNTNTLLIGGLVLVAVFILARN